MTEDIVRTNNHLPLCSQQDAGTLSAHFINQYLTNCRAVTKAEAVVCLDVLKGVADGALKDLSVDVGGEGAPALEPKGGLVE
jgi:hypothetical protein